MLSPSWEGVVLCTSQLSQHGLSLMEGTYWDVRDSTYKVLRLVGVSLNLTHLGASSRTSKVICIYVAVWLQPTHSSKRL